jgi:hypothetical protein
MGSGKRAPGSPGDINDISGASLRPYPCYSDAFVMDGDKGCVVGGGRRGRKMEGNMSRIFIVRIC